jgi:hypothetical protein
MEGSHPMSDHMPETVWPIAAINGGPLDGNTFPIHGVGQTLRWIDPLPGGIYRLVSYEDHRATYEWQPHEEQTHA